MLMERSVTSLLTKLFSCFFFVLGDVIRMGESKVEAITSWPTPTMIHDIHSFHGLALFYRRFIWKFCSIIAPMMEFMKGGKFCWTKEAENALRS